MYYIRPLAAEARSDVRPPCMRTVAGGDSHAQQHSFVETGHEIKFYNRWFKKGGCQLLAKECALSTGKLPMKINWPRPKWPEKCRRVVKHQHNNRSFLCDIINVYLRFSQRYYTKRTGYNTNCIGAYLIWLRNGTNTVRIVTNTFRKVTLTNS